MPHRSRFLALTVAVALAVLATLAPTGSATAAGGKPAPVKITLKPDATGRVISDRDGCVSEVDVYGILTAQGQLVPAGQTTTDSKGRYPADPARRGLNPKAFTLVLGNAKCRVAQSPTIKAPTRAGAPAKRKVSLQANQTVATGRVTSKRPGCVKNAGVVLFVRSGQGAPFVAGQTTTTDGKGRFSFGARKAHLRGLDIDLIAVAVGTGACRVAQSPTRTVS